MPTGLKGHLLNFLIENHFLYHKNPLSNAYFRRKKKIAIRPNSFILFKVYIGKYADNISKLIGNSKP